MLLTVGAGPVPLCSELACQHTSCRFHGSATSRLLSLPSTPSADLPVRRPAALQTDTTPPRMSKRTQPPPFVVGAIISTATSLMRRLSELPGDPFRDAGLRPRLHRWSETHRRYESPHRAGPRGTATPTRTQHTSLTSLADHLLAS